jgi:hypothetical protein
MPWKLGSIFGHPGKSFPHRHSHWHSPSPYPLPFSSSRRFSSNAALINAKCVNACGNCPDARPMDSTLLQRDPSDSRNPTFFQREIELYSPHRSWPNIRSARRNTCRRFLRSRSGHLLSCTTASIAKSDAPPNRRPAIASSRNCPGTRWPSWQRTGYMTTSTPGQAPGFILQTIQRPDHLSLQ